MLTPEQVGTLTRRILGTLAIPVNCGDRIDVAIAVVESTIRGLAPIVALDEPEGPTGIVPGAEEEKAPPEAG